MTQSATMQSSNLQACEPAAGDRLDSWKEIAAYLKRGARTVQRWEREKGLPVHRLRPDKLGSVFAFKTELDAWWANHAATLEENSAGEFSSAVDLTSSIAVLPFVDMSPKNDQAYFCDGLAEEIIHTLIRTANWQVASRTSSFQFRAPDVESREIGRRLGVGTLLEGSVRKWGTQVRVAVQLVDAENGFPIWAGTYDRKVKDILAAQEELAQSIAAALDDAMGGAAAAGYPAHMTTSP
jgi:TolB-like protein